MVGVTLLLPGALRIQGIPQHLQGSVGCGWNSESERVPWERLGVGLGIGQRLPDEAVPYSYLLEVSQSSRLPPSFLELFCHGRGFPSDRR